MLYKIKNLDIIVNNILSSKYQEQAANGYGIGINENGFVKSKFYSIGWDISIINLASAKELSII